MIIGTDPVSIDILKQIYGAINDISNERRSFLEKCWLQGIEEAYKNSSVKLDPDLCFKLLEQIYQHLEDKDIWEVKEEELYEIFEKIISLKATRDTSLREVFEQLEKSVTSILQLDFSNKIPLNNSFKDKRNIFNYIVLLFNSVTEKMESSMVSMKAVNAYFSKYPDVIFIVTDRAGNLRYVNRSGEQLLGLGSGKFLGLRMNDLIRDHSKLINTFNKNGKAEAFQTEILPCTPNAEPIRVTASIPELIKDRSEIDEIAFIIRKNDNKIQVPHPGSTKEIKKHLATIDSASKRAKALRKKLMDKKSKQLLDSLEKDINELKKNSIKALNSTYGVKM